jgi:Zn-dependent membrane protease YugP
MLLFYLVTALGGAFSLWASSRVKSAFQRYARVGVAAGLTGAEAAAAVCRAAGVSDVTIERHQGFLSDHYDPRSRTLRLSPEVFDGRSVSSIAVAAHEAGHAIQHARSYAWLNFRSAMVPVVSIGSQMWMPVLFLGALVAGTGGALLGIGLFALVVLFQLVTLPVEFDASKRAKAVLASSGIVATREEAEGVERVLGAAALTYVAGAAAGMAQLLVLVMQFTGGSNQD